MKKQLYCGLLCLTVLFGLFAGCADRTTAEPAVPAAETAQAEPADVAAAAPAESVEPPATEIEDPPAEESGPGEIPQAEGFLDENFSGQLSEAVIEYPLQFADSTVTFWCDFYSGFEQYGLSSFNDLPTLPYVKEKTGIQYEFTCVSESAATEQFQLMIAGGDWTDVLMSADFYANGLGQAYEDEVIIDLTDLLPDNAPDYWNYIQQANQTTLDTVMTDGRHLQMCSLRDAVYADGGYMFRGDWADALGYSFDQSITIDEITSMLYDMQKTYAPQQTLYVTQNGSIYGASAFETTAFSINNATSLPMYRNGDSIVCSFGSPEYRDYLAYFAQLYTDGLIGSDFYITTADSGTMFSLAGSGALGMWYGFADSINKGRDYTSDPNWRADPLPIVVDDDGENKFTSDTAYANNKGYQVSGACDEPEKVLRFFNWFNTKEGYEFANYGILGETYTINADGLVEFTDKIMNNPEIPEYMMAMQIYCFTKAPALEIQSKLWSLYDIESVQAIRLWSADSFSSSACSIPLGAALTTEETGSIVNEVNDVISYATEQVLKFMTGTIPITDESWQAFTDACNSFGMQKVIDTYQQAYDSYLAGERKAESGGPPPMPGGGPPPMPGGGPPPQ